MVNGASKSANQNRATEVNVMNNRVTQLEITGPGMIQQTWTTILYGHPKPGLWAAGQGWALPIVSLLVQTASTLHSLSKALPTQHAGLEMTIRKNNLTYLRVEPRTAIHRAGGIWQAEGKNLSLLCKVTVEYTSHLRIEQFV